ncbi:MAG: hypothetical protein ACYTF0_02810 [Planctomycetota bacterium]|jgi:hypothetical protein
MSIRVQLDPTILDDLICSDTPQPKAGQDRGDYDRSCALREHQVYRLLRSVVSQFNTRLKGRRERFKLIDEGDGLIIEFSE